METLWPLGERLYFQGQSQRLYLTALSNKILLGGVVGDNSVESEQSLRTSLCLPSPKVVIVPYAKVIHNCCCAGTVLGSIR